MTTQPETRPLTSTAAAKDMLKFIGISDEAIRCRISESGLLSDTSTYAARKLPYGTIYFVAFRNGVEEIRLFLASEWLNDFDVLKATPVSWTNG